MSTPARYKAFISYSHADEAWATWLHKALEAYRVPTKLVGRESPVGAIPKKLFPIFKDRDELASAHQLGSELEKALHDSASLIVLCSPRAAQSKWVNEEIKLYKAMGRAERVFCLIVDGEPGDADRECFPEAARFQVDDAGQITDLPAEPIAADVRAGGDGKMDAKLKLIAGILGVGFNELKQRELAARNRRLTALASVASVIAVITVGLAILAVQARDEAHAQRQIAEARQGQAEGLIQFMLGDLREKLEPIGKLDILDAVGEQAMAYFGQVSPETLSDTELAARAQALRQIGRASSLTRRRPSAKRCGWTRNWCAASPPISNPSSIWRRASSISGMTFICVRCTSKHAHGLSATTDQPTDSTTWRPRISTGSVRRRTRSITSRPS